MIAGSVTPDGEVGIPIVVRDAAGTGHQMQAVIDTGFTDYLVLPPDTIRRLNLPFDSAMPMQLADGSVVLLAVYLGVVEWNGRLRNIPIHEADTDPLVGVALLHGSRLCVDFIDGGSVTIDDLP